VVVDDRDHTDWQLLEPTTATEGHECLFFLELVGAEVSGG
jgi:hypothetical protein